MADSPDFKYELFEREEEYEETPLRDRKRNLYEFPTKNNKHIAEFVRDIISLANTACLYRRPAYLLLGIGENGEEKTGIKRYEVTGLEEHLRKFKGDITQNEGQVWEEVRKTIANVIYEYIQPRVKWELKHGTLRRKVNGTEKILHVAYILIHPVIQSRPYAAAREIEIKERIKTNGKTEIKDKSIKTGQSWIRIGEGKRDVSLRELFRSEWENLVQVPFILPSRWLIYFEKLHEQKDLIAAQQVDPYIPLSLRDERPLDALAREFLDSPEHQLLVLRGGAGCGKSLFLKRWVFQHAEAGIAQIQDIIRNEEFSPPPGWIPIYMQLTGSGERVSNLEGLAHSLLDEVNNLCRFREAVRETGGYSHEEGLFEKTDLNWLICLDGLDEIWNDEGQRCFLSDALRPFMKKFPRTKLVLTSRPYAVSANFEEWPRTVVGDIRPLKREEIETYLMVRLGDEKIFGEVRQLLDDYPDLETIYASPAHLAASVESLGRGMEGKPIDAPQEAAEISEELIDLEENQSDNELTSPVLDLLELAQEVDKELLESSPQDEGKDKEIGLQGTSQNDREEEEPLPPIPLGRVLNDIYEYLWDRECERRHFRKEDTDRWWDETTEIALEFDGHKPRFRRKEVEKKLSSKDAFYWLLHLGILIEKPRRLCAFFTLLTQAYFAADHVAQLLETNDRTIATRGLSKCQEDFRRLVCLLLQGISPYSCNNIEQEIVLPIWK